ncbi:MAG TPA: 16S rRNA (guanine(966)-N(2))-methyltransferase RsmD [Mycobacteriales bacterium]|nr:16S rRNA (guanine(966)-N(2))-methyltransferase RsmD [Mycobacteriales bacterium]
MTRIVAGSVGGRRIAVPPGRDTRPTTDRAREALFATLGTLVDLAGARVLDLFAGSGAVGLEALSRGAGHALLVESDPHAARLVADNARALGLTGARVACGPVARVLAAGPSGGYRVVFADPPYSLPDAEVDAVLVALVGHGWLDAGGVVAVERPSRGAGPSWPEGMEPVRSRRYGEGTLWYGRRL